MFSMPTSARALFLRASAAAAVMVVLCGDNLSVGGCSSPYPGQSDAHLSVTTTQPAGTWQPGDTVHFRTTVTNDGVRDIGGIRIDAALDYNLEVTSASCTGQGESDHAGGQPPACGERTEISRMPIGAVATVDLVATVRSAESATVRNRFSVTVTNGPGYTTYSSVALANAPGGGYRAYTAAGQKLDASIDFARSTLTFAGAGGRTLPFGAPTASGTYALPGGAAWRQAPDLLVGTADLGSGVKPFVAARRFVTTADELEGRTFALLEVETPASGPAVSHVRTVTVEDSTMWMCVDAVRAIGDCPPASLRHFPLSNYGGVFSGGDTATFDTVYFRVARSSDTLVLLSAEPTPTPTSAGRAFQVGLSTHVAGSTGVFEGGDTLGRWGTLEVAPAGSSLRETLALAHGSPLVLDGTLSPQPDAPARLVAGTLGDAAPAIWFAQDGPLAAVIGRPGSSIDGLLQLFLR